MNQTSALKPTTNLSQNQPVQQPQQQQQLPQTLAQQKQVEFPILSIRKAENSSEPVSQTQIRIEPVKYSTLNEITFFDRLKKALRTQQVFENFLKCLALFNQSIITRSELIELVEPFLGKFANLYRWFKDYVENKPISSVAFDSVDPLGDQKLTGTPMTAKSRIMMPVDVNCTLEIDYLSCRQYGASYRDVSAYPQPVSSSQTELCKNVITVCFDIYI